MHKRLFHFPALVLLSVLIVGSHAELTKALSLAKSPRPEAQIPTAQAVRLVSLGFDNLIADYYWLRFIEYVGDTNARVDDHYSNADRYLDLIIELNPSFMPAYWFAAYTIGGDMKNPVRSKELIEKGIAEFPSNWSLLFIAGVNAHLFAHDEHSAATYYRQASQCEHAPAWLLSQAEILESDAPRQLKEAVSWFNAYQSAIDAKAKATAKNKCIELSVRTLLSAPNESYAASAREMLVAFNLDVAKIKQADKAQPRRRSTNRLQ